MKTTFQGIIREKQQHKYDSVIVTVGKMENLENSDGENFLTKLLQWHPSRNLRKQLFSFVGGRFWAGSSCWSWKRSPESRVHHSLPERPGYNQRNEITIEYSWEPLVHTANWKKYYEHCLLVNEFAVRFLTQSLNECVVEVQVSTISSIDNPSRTMSHTISKNLTFISSNGPHPLKAMGVIEEALNLHFKGKPWYFALSNNKFYVSRVVDRL